MATTLAEAGMNNAISIIANPNNAYCLMQPDLMPARTSDLPGRHGHAGGGRSTRSWSGPDGHVDRAEPDGPDRGADPEDDEREGAGARAEAENLDVDVWNTIYSPGSGSSGCDTTFDQGVDLKVKLYVGGNLCVENSANAETPVFVNGWLDIKNKQSPIGSRTNTLSAAHVGAAASGSNNVLRGRPARASRARPAARTTNLWLSALERLERAEPDFPT